MTSRVAELLEYSAHIGLKGRRMSILRAAGVTFQHMDKPDLEKQRLKEACQEFESFLNQHLLNSMDESIMKAEEPDQARETYEAMFRETLSQELSRHSNGGIADLLYKQLAPLLPVRPEARESIQTISSPNQEIDESNR
jgi:Rod binding domain-containing protein